MIHLSISHNEGVYYYALFYIAAILLGLAAAGIAARKRNYTLREFAIIVSFGILSLIIGSKLMMFSPEQWKYLLDEGQLPPQYGKSAFGAVMGAIIGIWVAGKLIGKKESVLDLFAVAVPLGLALQGFGCLTAGCCYGSITNVPWGIVYGPESNVFQEQQHMGFISPDALHSLAVHPSQAYSIIICILIALIVWKTSGKWKSPSGNFLFSIILYLAYRTAEAISSYSIPTGDWMGMKIVYWKILILLFFTLLFTYREWKYTYHPIAVNERRTRAGNNDIRIFLLSLFVLFTSLQFGDWLTREERIVLLLSVIPLCVLIVLDKLVLILISMKYARLSWMLLFAIVLMSQKADNPAGMPASYTSIHLEGLIGNFDINHTFNEVQYYDDCLGTYWIGDDLGYHHSYGAGGIGFSRTKYLSEWKSNMIAVNVYAGSEKEKPIYNPNPDFDPPSFSNTLWGVSSKYQYDARGIGIGLGAAFGGLGFDKEDDPDDHSDYTPEKDGRDISFQFRTRFFSERYCFLEILGGYDAGSIGDYSWQGLLGSRFNSQQWMLKAGLAGTRNGNAGYVFQGQAPLGANLFLTPEFIFYRKEDNYHYPGGGNRIVIGLEYRLPDKVK